MTFRPAPGYHPTYNPTLPFCKPVPCDLNVGTFVYIAGVAHQNLQSFVVNFALGPDAVRDDIAFHFNPRFAGWNKVVFNARLSGKWGAEEEKRKIPFKNGEHFDMLVMITQEHYKVLVNGNHFYEFGHQTPIQKVTHLYVDGNMTLQLVSFLGSTPTSSEVQSELHGNVRIQEADLEINFTLKPMLYMRRLQGGLKTNRTIIVVGFIPLSAHRFFISFIVGTTGDIALHINVSMDEKAVVRNSFLKGAWGPEERSISYNPFAPGQYFDLSIHASTDNLKVFANGQHIFDYEHRVSATLADILEISGDVILSYVQV
ncbi:galectin-4-like [Sorex araneus]|uniref:galectin-4-like n=1 Tax=Sorex araneus TaxID=42254 RepID=UPI002433A05E|nr:galectin-4-like [Sorex araneus]